MKSMTKTRGCGCGGKSGCGCGCGSTASRGTDIATACAPCDEAAFVRPQFFAGQLLTEDDLTALETYVVGKNRLHNAKLFGEGVVCGLEVSCGPCDGTTVMVSPGYALDCCGNDLVLTCDREIDLKPLIIALREQKHGKGDCGNPCGPPKPCNDPKPDCGDNNNDGDSNTNEAKVNVDRAAAERGRRPAPTSTPKQPSKPAEPKSVVLEYCLYLRYTETASDPIANYPNQDDCAVSCQPTRLREGVSFELRCPDVPVRDDIVTHLEACLGRLSSPDRVTGDGRSFEIYARQVRRALTLMDKPLDRFDTTERLRWEAKQTELDRIAERAREKYDPTGDDLVSWTELLIDVGGMYIRQRATQSEDSTKTFMMRPAATDAAVDYMLSKLSNENERLKIASAIDRLAATAAVLKYKSVADNFSLKGPHSYSDELFLRGGLMTTGLRGSFIATAQDLRGKLMQAIGCDGGNTSDCTLYDDLRNLSLPTPQQIEQEVEPADAADFANFGNSLAGLIKRFFMDCICRAFNPPCRPCDDPAVLLACVKVRDCQVIEVCNMARTYVLSPTAMRYWLPPISWIGDLLEKLCCPSDSCGDEDLGKHGTDNQVRFINEMLRRPSAQSAALVLPAFYHSGAYLPSLVAASRSFGHLAARRLLPGDSRLQVPAIENVGRILNDNHAAEVEALRHQVAELHARLDLIDAKAGTPPTPKGKGPHR